VEILDFEDLFGFIDDDIKPMVPSLQETDRKEISNMISGNIKSHLSNNRPGSTLFHSCYIASVTTPMLNFISWDDLVDYKFMEIPSTDIELRLLNNEGKLEN
jgi:hypothetical protein